MVETGLLDSLETLYEEEYPKEREMNILLITSIYPIPNIKITGSTSVCHYFAKEWIKQGHQVIVINTYTVYPRIFHWLSNMIGKTIANVFPVSINTTRFSEPLGYEMDGVEVLLIPTYKPFPKADFPSNSIEHTAKEIVKFLRTKDFIPDIITSHFIHPNLELIPELKKTFPSVPCGVSLHGKISSEKRIREIEQANDKVDFWGFRSYPIGRSFKENCFLPLQTLYCFSGVPQNYICPQAIEKHGYKGVSTFLFVGNLNKRKHPLTVLEALMDSDIDYSLTYVGSGKQTDGIQNKVKQNNLQSHVSLCGRLSRSEVSKKMYETECFIMVSEDETFGLVYLEAMANGCIVVASKNEGMDGIIQNGVNGFLCEAGNRNELTETIKTINGLTQEEKMSIARNAIETAISMTDSKVAQNYLNDLLRIKNQNI